VKITTRSQGPFPSDLAKQELTSTVAETVREEADAVEEAVEVAVEEAVEAGAGPEAAAVAPPRAASAAKVATTGVVFVHGIGSQQPGETLLQWSSPLIEGITAWRSWAAKPTDGQPLDPVSTAAIDFATGMPTITLEIPAFQAPDGGPTFGARRWIITENWWAAKVAPPGLATMASWLGPQGGVGQIVDAILGNRGPESTLLWLARAAVVPFVSVLAGLVLTVYTLVRGIVALIPVQAVRDAAVLRTFDEFLTGWFGDARILLFDPAQSANIRAGLAKAIRRLRDEGCDSVVVVAHSGGAMVSYLTLTDPALAPTAQVDKLITFGEGWNLALILTPNGAGMWDRLRRDITLAQPKLRWRDFWASHDPAPAGVVRWTEMSPWRWKRPRRIRSKRVWNRRSLLDDHGTYFDNDEEFTIPVLREIDVPDGWGEDSRFLRPDTAEVEKIRDGLDREAAEEAAEEVALEPAVLEARAANRPLPPLSRPPRDAPEARISGPIRRHRERVAILALWRHLSLSVPVAVVAVVLSFPDRLEDLGELVAQRLPRIPLVADAIDWLRPLRSIVIDLPGLAPFDIYPAANLLGLATLQAIVLIAVLQLVAAPVGAFHAWSERTHLRRAVFAVEAVLAVALMASLLPLLAAPDHERFLGAGIQAWLPGIVATALTLAFGLGGPPFVRLLGSGAASRFLGVGATVLFLVAIASTVVTIFNRDGLEMAELGYVAIWLAFLVLYRIGHQRWRQWDRVERKAAYLDPREVPAPSRTPALVSAFGFLTATAALVAYTFDWAPEVFGALAISAITLIVVAILIGARAWSRHGDRTAEPPPVESARTAA
jgi:hypothetical protein